MRTEAVAADSAVSHRAASDKAVPEKTASGGPGRQEADNSAGIDIERDIQLVLAFLNTCDIEAGTEVLDDPADWQQWCSAREVGGAPGTGEARGVRDALRTSVSCGADPQRSDSPPDHVETPVPLEWPVRVQLHGGVPMLTGTDAVSSVLAAATRLVTTGHWHRIKICPAENCLWAFYDRSRNRSRTWCSMRVCGNREKARSWRERRTAG